MKRLDLWTICLGTLFAFGCAHQEAKTPPPSAAAPIQSAPMAAPTPPAKNCSLDTDCLDGQLCVSNQCVKITPELAECSGARVHFAFNRWDVEAADRPVLERVARCLRADRVLHVQIEGNADERGTEEYNLHLGDKRATAVERYLANLGASPSQLKTVSYGKDQPLCSEHNEECWAQNRRAALKPRVADSAK